MTQRCFRYPDYCKHCHNGACKSLMKLLKNMETKEVKIEIPEGYEIDENKSSFEKIVFKKKENKLPRSWKEYIDTKPTVMFSYHVGDSVIPTQYEGAFTALNKLIRLRDVYNDGWKPDWNGEKIHSIFYSNKEIKLDTRTSWQCVLVFKSRELRDEFFVNFKDLIEQAKELL